MTLQQLHYAITIAEAGSLNKAAEALYISQPSLTSAMQELEKELGISIFVRSGRGVSLTQDGSEFLLYAREVYGQYETLLDKYGKSGKRKKKFGVSTQHYSFAVKAFVELVQHFGQERFEFILNETQTHQIIEDVRNRFSDIGILYISNYNESVLIKVLEENDLSFHEIFSASPHVFLRRDHPLACRESLKLDDLKPYPKLSFVQGNYESAYFAEELFSNEPAEKSIKVSDRAAIVNFMIGLDGYTISSGIFPKFLQGDEIVSVPLEEPEVMRIGYIINKDKELSELGQIYIEALKKFK